MSQRAYVAHRLPGRMRLSLPHARRNERALKQIKEAVASARGVRSVEISPVAGSVLIHYDRAWTSEFEDDVRRLGTETGTFHLVTPEVDELTQTFDALEQDAEWLAEHSAAARAIVNGVSALNEDVKKATNGALDLKVLVPLSLAVYSLLHRKSNLSTPLWVTLGLFSFNSFIALHHPPVPAQPARAPTRGTAAPEPSTEAGTARPPTARRPARARSTH